MAPVGIRRSPVIGGGDCLTLGLVIIPFKSSDVDSGDGSDTVRGGAEGAGSVRRFLVKYEADRGSTGLELVDGD